MRKHLKNYFIPHKGNDHKPHFLRPKTTLYAAAAIFFVEIIFLLQILYVFPSINFFGLVLPDVLIDQTNTRRTENAVLPLSVNPLLQEAAKLKAQDMAAKGYFNHTSPEGLTPWHWFKQVGYQYAYAGENLAVNFVDSQDVTNAWMQSPAHRENILNGRFTEIGIATAEGSYNGKDATFVVQLFGKPATFSTATSSAPAPTPTQTPAPEPLAIDETQTETSNEIFVAVRGAETISAEPVLQDVIPAIAKQMPAQASRLEQLLAAPRATANLVLLLFAVLVMLALVLAIFIRIDIQHPRLIANGVLLLAIIAGIFIVNQYLTLSRAQVL